LGPSAWQPGKNGKGSGKRASKSSGANMEAVTPGSIAYAAKFVSDSVCFFFSSADCFQAYFGLSSAETHRKQGGEFDFCPMYWQIVRLFEEEYLKEDTKALLQWWNQCVYNRRDFPFTHHGSLDKYFPSNLPPNLPPKRRKIQLLV
jgi:hypothetical protein